VRLPSSAEIKAGCFTRDPVPRPTAQAIGSERDRSTRRGGALAAEVDAKEIPGEEAGDLFAQRLTRPTTSCGRLGS
jgi:hypothetical protein